MKEIIYFNRFKRDYKLAAERHLNLEKLHDITRLLASDAALPERCKPHKLEGNYFGYWECHLEPDWLLIYRLKGSFWNWPQPEPTQTCFGDNLDREGCRVLRSSIWCFSSAQFSLLGFTVTKIIVSQLWGAVQKCRLVGLLNAMPPYFPSHVVKVTRCEN